MQRIKKQKGGTATVTFTKKTEFDIFREAVNAAGPTAVLIPVNGMLKKNGRAVTGAGLAKQADDRYGISKSLGQNIRLHGNEACIISTERPAPFTVVAFPTKNDWRDPSDPELIRRSAGQTDRLLAETEIRSVFVPKAGCGLGGLDWNLIRPMLENIWARSPVNYIMEY